MVYRVPNIPLLIPEKVFAMRFHHGNISVQNGPQISTLNIVNMGEIWDRNQNDKKMIRFNISP